MNARRNLQARKRSRQREARRFRKLIFTVARNVVLKAMHRIAAEFYLRKRPDLLELL